ncbi:MAG: hypothetical protein ACP5VQ_00360 [Phycisphaerae bacterium]
MNPDNVFHANWPIAALSTGHWTLGTGHPWLMILLLAAAAAVGGWSYRHQTATPSLKLTMAITRAVILALVVLLLAQPVFVMVHTLRRPAVVAIWVDTSRSMTLRDAYESPAKIKLIDAVRQALPPAAAKKRPTRFNVACWSLDQAANTWLKVLAKNQSVAIFTGGAHAHLLGIANSPTQLMPLLQRLAVQKPHANATNVPGVLADIFNDLQGRPISAVLTYTDGRSTGPASMSLVHQLAKAGATPILAVPIGQIHPPFALKIADAQAPRHAFVQDPVAVRAKVRITGATATQSTIIRLFAQTKEHRRGRELTSERITIHPGTAQQNVSLMFHPSQPGTYHLILVADPLPHELTHRGNTSRGVWTRVVRAKVRILYVEGYPRWEYRYLKNDLMREKTTLLSCLLLSADNRFAQEGNIPINRFPDTQAEMNRYDVLLLGDVNPDYFSAAQEKIILRFVGRYGGGFGMIAGADYAPDAYRRTPLARLLPIIAGNPDNPMFAPPPNEPFELHLTAIGRQSMLFHFFKSRQKNLRQVADLPPLYWFEPVAGLQPSATVLADLPSHRIDGRPAPLLVFGRYGAGRTMFSAIDDTWRWRYYHGAPLYKSYWLEMMRELARQRVFGGSRGIVLRMQTPRVQVGQSNRIFLSVRNPQLISQMPASVPVMMTSAGGRQTIVLSPVSSSHRQYEGEVTPWAVGHYTLTAKPGILPGAVKPVEMDVTASMREFTILTADPAALARLVADTGGAVVPLAGQSALARLIPDRSVEVAVRQSRQLWNKPWALALLILLLTVEWILRKRAGLI